VFLGHDLSWKNESKNGEDKISAGVLRRVMCSFHIKFTGYPILTSAIKYVLLHSFLQI